MTRAVKSARICRQLPVDDHSAAFTLPVDTHRMPTAGDRTRAAIGAAAQDDAR
jgi:hypothetical protein